VNRPDHRWIVAAGVCACLLAAGWVQAAAGNGPPASNDLERLKQAVERYDEGAYAEALALLEALKQTDLGDKANSRRDRYARLAADKAVEVFQEVQEAAQEDVAEAEARDRDFADRMQRLYDEAKRCEADGDYARARDLYLKVAARRAAYALDVAERLLRRGETDTAVAVLKKVAESGIALGRRDARRLEDLLARAPILAANYQAGKTIFEQRQAEAARKAQQAEAVRRLYDAVAQAFEEAERAATPERKVELYAQVTQRAGELAKRGAAVAEVLEEAERERLEEMASTAREQEARIRDERLRAQRYLAEGLDLEKKNEFAAARTLLYEALRTKALSAADRTKALEALSRVMAKLQAAEAKRRAEYETVRARIAERLRQQERAAALRKKLAELAALDAQNKKTIADRHYKLAKSYFDNAKFDEALKELDTALGQVPDHAEARDLKDKILLLQGKGWPVKTIAEQIHVLDEVRREQARLQMTAHIQKAMEAREAGRYEEALQSLKRARSILAYLSTFYNVTGTRKLIDEEIRTVEQKAAVARRELKTEREKEAGVALAEEGTREIEMAQQRFRALYEKALRFYSMRDYENAVDTVKSALKLSPRDPAALSLLRKAEDAYRKRVWVDIRDLAEKARRDKLINIKRKLVARPELIVYPSAEVWKEITERGPVPLPSGKVRKTPRELQLEEALETRVSLEYEVPTELSEIIAFLNEIIRNEIGAANTIRLDPKVVELDPRNVQITQKDIKLRKALTLLLTDASTEEEVQANDELDYFIYRDAGVIYISKKQRLQRLRMKEKEFRFYDVRDLLAVLGARGGGGGGNNGGNNDDDDYYSDDDDSGNNGGNNGGDNGGGGAGLSDLRNLIVELTGPENWGAVGGVGGGGNNNDSSGDDDDLGGGLLTGGAGEVTTTGATYLGRMYSYGTGDLLVEQTPEIHRRIEEVLTRLRKMVENQVYCEVRFIRFRDNFLQSFGVSSFGEIREKVGRPKDEFGDLGEHLPLYWPRFETLATISSIPPTSGELTGGLEATISFLDHPERTMILSAVKESNFANVMQAPSLLVMNTEESDISLATTTTYTSGFQVSEETGTLIPETSTADNSVDVWFRPVISADRRYVTIEVEPTFDTVDELQPRLWEDTITYVDPNGVSTTRTFQKTYFEPITSSKTFYARVRVPDRGSVILAGLTDATSEDREGGVPILINIPLIKRLFGAKSEVERRTHQVFLITTTIMMPEEIEGKMPVY